MPDFSPITEQLYVGGYLEDGDWHILAALGVTVDINLMGEAQDRFTPHAAPDVYLWLPIVDWTAPDQQTLQTGARFIELMVEQGRSVYVHCFAGVGRSPTLAAAYLVTTGLSSSEALQLLKEKRPVVDPNRAQIRALQAFERSLKT
ncbi:MAG: dual specificity protein phosphatase family protein [Chloroflexi bacterium]|nr:dual specificity protein phosphatase family protein [Chloroflexota bacterium]